eukprot:TRINITY_DN5787_c0_g1_i1.p2 TRINITY_DN5787_c0_g1~~TRINITY_DN5787_c0_g1_i1.p2  ORF type:complete len:451 (-),score=78.33 TRINITY_DN5787_c0_g1_i1:190-1542(-)
MQSIRANSSTKSTRNGSSAKSSPPASIKSISENHNASQHNESAGVDLENRLELLRIRSSSSSSSSSDSTNSGDQPARKSRSSSKRKSSKRRGHEGVPPGSGGSFTDLAVLDQQGNHLNSDGPAHTAYEADGPSKAGQPQSKPRKVSLSEFRSNLEDGVIEEPTRILWVGNISPSVTQEELLQEFGKHGAIESLRILHERFCAFINFIEAAGAEQAKKALQGTIFYGQHIVINYRKEKGNEPNAYGDSAPMVLNVPSSALWIGNIGETLTEEELYSEFAQHGPIESVRLLKHKTCAFVNFVKVEHAVIALNATQGKVVGTTALKINFGKPLHSTAAKSGPFLLAQPVLPAAFFQGFQIAAVPQLDNRHAAFPFVGYPQMVAPSEYMPYYVPIPSQNLCEVCRTNFKDTVVLPCGHTYCHQCAARIQYSTNPTCSFCNGKVSHTAPTYSQFA